MKYLLFLSVLLLPFLCKSQDTARFSLQFPITTYHILGDDYVTNGVEYKYNAENFGILGEYWISPKIGILAGYYNNSYHDNTWTIGVDLRKHLLFSKEKMFIGGMIGIASGYENWNRFDWQYVPIFSFYVGYQPHRNFNVKIPVNPVFIGLMLELKFGYK